MAKDLTETKLDNDDTHSNADSISNLQWEFGKPEPAETETTMATDIEEDTAQNEKKPDTEPTRANNKNPRKATPKSARAKTKIDCVKIRCRVALVTGNMVGMVTVGDHKKSCQRCKNFDKELAALEKIESTLLGNAHNLKLHRIIASPHQSRTKEDLRTLLTEDLGIEEPPKKVYSKLANTLLLTQHHGSLHTDIDQPFKGTQREGI